MYKHHENPEYYARDLLNVLDISTPPIDPFKIAIMLGFDFRFESLRNCEAILICKNGKKRIIMKDFSYFEKKLSFTVAHEIGHFILPWHSNIIYNCTDKDLHSYQYKNQETEANLFASELLLPTELFSKDIEDLDLSLNNIIGLSEKFQTSITSTAIKAVKITEQKICLVYTEDNKVKWIIPSKEFNEKIAVGKLSPLSYAYDFYTKGIDIQDSTDVYPIAWIYNHEKYVKIREENIFLKRFNSTLTILTLPDDSYEDSIDDDMFYS